MSCARSRRSWPSAASTAPCSAPLASAAAAASARAAFASARAATTAASASECASTSASLSARASASAATAAAAAAAAASRSSSTSASASAISSRRSATVASSRMPRARSSAARCDSSCSWRRQRAAEHFRRGAAPPRPGVRRASPACLRDSSEAESASPSIASSCVTGAACRCTLPRRISATWRPLRSRLAAAFAVSSSARRLRSSSSRRRTLACDASSWVTTRACSSCRLVCPFCSAASALPRFTASPTALVFSVVSTRTFSRSRSIVSRSSAIPSVFTAVAAAFHCSRKDSPRDEPDAGLGRRLARRRRRAAAGSRLLRRRTRRCAEPRPRAFFARGWPPQTMARAPAVAAEPVVRPAFANRSRGPALRWSTPPR